MILLSRLRQVLKKKDARKALNDQSGSSLPEFAIVGPVLMMMLFGIFDFSHTLYMQAMVDGEVARAAREAGLIDDTPAQTVIEQAAVISSLKAQIKTLHSGAIIDVTPQFFTSYTRAANPVGEAITLDANSNGVCNTNDEYFDENSSGTYDASGIPTGQGGARDVVKYNVTVNYPRMFPIHAFFGGSNQTVIKSTAVLTNQPYNTQSIGSTQKC